MSHLHLCTLPETLHTWITLPSFPVMLFLSAFGHCPQSVSALEIPAHLRSPLILGAAPTPTLHLRMSP